MRGSAPARLRALLAKPDVHLMPCCFDALSARLVERAKFPVTFASGFSVSAAHGLPDTGLMSFGEMEASMRRITGALQEIPCIGDGDTGYGNAVNTKRTVRGYAAAGLAGVMIEDQVAPKRCGHTRDKAVVDRPTALARIRAAVDASREASANEDDSILILARTDACVLLQRTVLLLLLAACTRAALTVRSQAQDARPRRGARARGRLPRPRRRHRLR
jgi:2-methylisocitrate lyase-like PEP mutase family enzyme